VNFQGAPAGLGLHSQGNAREFGDDGKLIAGARDGKERALHRPGRNGRIGRKLRYGEAFSKEREFETAGRRGHEGLAETPHQTIVSGLLDGRRNDGNQTRPLVLWHKRLSISCEIDGGRHQKLV
jgi:hypothetical protein